MKLLICQDSDNNFLKYCRYLGWSEYDVETEEHKNVAIVVIDANIGYSVFRDGRDLTHLQWFFELEDAMECACERVQYEHATHEIGEQKGKDVPEEKE